jgi:cobalt-precorrin 5A hydrolase
MPVSIIAITRKGAQLGNRLAGGFSDCELHVLRKFHGAAIKGSRPFDDLRELISSLWQKGDDLVCIMATGIVVRMTAPLLISKDVDPAVVVMDEAGKFAISLLSGHLGGANQLAERSAWLVGARAVITTATDVNHLPSFDLLAKDQDWVIEDLASIKLLNSLLLDDQPIAVVDSTDRVRAWFHGQGRLFFFDTLAAALKSPAQGFLFVTNRQLPKQVSPPNLLILRPRNLVLGIGCNSGTSADEIEALVQQHLKRLLLSPRSICCIATTDAKKEEHGLLEFASRCGVPLVCFSNEELNSIDAPSPPSEHALAAIGAKGVAEPAAMLAAGNRDLLLKKVKSDNVTLAVSEKQVGDQ